MFKSLLTATLLVAATTSFASAKDTLYIVNSGSTGGSYNAQLQAWMTDLDDHYDINFIHAKGCAKASAVLAKIAKDPNNEAISIYSATWKHSSDACSFLYPKEDTFFFNTQKSGLIYQLKGGNKELLTSGNTIAFNGGNDEYIAELGAANGVEFKTVRYQNSKGVTLGVMNGEADFGIINSGSQFWKNQDKLDGVVMLGPKGWKDMASISSINGRPKSGYDNYLYFGKDRTALHSTMSKIFADKTSTIRKWSDGNEAYWSNIDSTDKMANFADFTAEYPR